MLHKFQYFKADNSEWDVGGVSYYEFLGKYAHRKCSLGEKDVLSSISFHDEYGDPNLPEGELKWMVEFLTQITRDEFEEAWSKLLLHYSNSWEKIKKKYPINTEIESEVLMFYPQGVLSNIGKSIFLSESTEFQKVVPQDEQYPKTKFKGVVVNHNDKFNWIEISRLRKA